MDKWAVDFIQWCDEYNIEVPRTQEELLNLEVFIAENKGLHSIHPNIVYLEKLIRLVVNDNFLKDLPSLPKNLITLIAKNNLFSEIPQSIRGLKHFSHLLIANNMIDELPSWIEEVENLITLDLGNNKMTSIQGIKKNKKIKILLVPNNKVEDISPIYDLEELRIFDFYKNRVRAFDKRIRKLKKLDTFVGFENNIEEFDLFYLIANQKVEIRLELMDSFKLRLYRAWAFFRNTLRKR